MKKLEQTLRTSIETIHDFPKPGIAFKDIQSILSNPGLMKAVKEALIDFAQTQDIDAIIGMDSRGFLFGPMIAEALEVPFIMARKPGKLPPSTESVTYEKEYGTDTLHIRKGSIKKGARVLVHDDLLATGGTARAAAELVEKVGGIVAGFSFIIELGDLDGARGIKSFAPISSLVTF